MTNNFFSKLIYKKKNEDIARMKKGIQDLCNEISALKKEKAALNIELMKKNARIYFLITQDVETHKAFAQLKGLLNDQSR